LSKINSQIYRAQCFGNIEPIEYMVPYPNLRSLVVGQCIKFSENCLFQDLNMTNGEFLKQINKTANWLIQKGIQKDNRLLVYGLASPKMEILSYAIWSIGALLVIINDYDLEFELTVEQINPELIIDKISKKDISEIQNQSSEYQEICNIQLYDDAIIYFKNERGIRLSHYNLLINTYGLLKYLNILHSDILNIDIPNNTTAAIVLKTILPLYAGTSVTNNSAKIKFGTDEKSDYQIVIDWNKLENTNPQSLYVLPEATAILAIGATPNHLIAIDETENYLIINGHSVMQGYLNKHQNEAAFKSGSLKISK